MHFRPSDMDYRRVDVVMIRRDTDFVWADVNMIRADMEFIEVDIEIVLRVTGGRPRRTRRVREGRKGNTSLWRHRLWRQAFLVVYRLCFLDCRLLFLYSRFCFPDLRMSILHSDCRFRTASFYFSVADC